MTRDCLEDALYSVVDAGRATGEKDFVDFVRTDRDLDNGLLVRFLAGLGLRLGIKISSVERHHRRTTEAPSRPKCRRGTTRCTPVHQ